MRRAVAGPALAALTTGLMFASSAAAAAADTGGGSAASTLARVGAVTASRADVGSCVTLTGGGFVPGREISVSDGKQPVRTVKSGENGAIAAGVCFNGNARPGVHVVSATGPQRGGGTRTVTSDVYVVGGSSVARAPHQSTAAGHARVASIIAVALLAGLPLLVLAVTLTLLLRAGGRVRSRRRLRRQAHEASLVFEHGGARPSRRRAAVIPLLAGLAVAVLLSVAYGAARGSDLLHQVRVASTDLSAAVRHLQHGESDAATAQAQRAVAAAVAARHDASDPVVRVLAKLPGLRPLADALRTERRVAESAAVAVGAAPSDQQAAAASGLTTLGRVDDTGWAAIDDRADTLRAALRALGSQANARAAGDDLRAPMLSAGRRYLLLVQDDRQARATGGVVTAHALLTAGSHSLSLGSVGPADSSWQAINLTPDFPTVAATAVELWEHESRGAGGSVDGVVAVDDVALSRLGADPAAGPVDQLRAAFDTLRAATRTPIGFNAAIVSAGSGGHVQLWSAHPDEERQLASLTIGGALSGRPANSFEVVTQSVDDATGGPGDAGSLRRDVAYSWRPTLRRDDVGAGLQLMNEAGVDVRLTNEAASPQLTWVLLYLPRGSGFLRATVDGTPVTLHSGEEQDTSVISTLVDVPGNGSTLLSVSLVSPTPDGRPPVYIRQPRVVPDEVAVTRV